jgi:DNA-binding response OmpR family regulator
MTTMTMRICSRTWSFGRKGDYDFRVAYDGASALQICDAYQPDVILIDNGMPGMSGLSLAEEQMKKCGHALPLFAAVSGYKKVRDRWAKSNLGEYFVKPVDTEVLRHRLEARKAVIGKKCGRENGTT